LNSSSLNIYMSYKTYMSYMTYFSTNFYGEKLNILHFYIQ